MSTDILRSFPETAQETRRFPVARVPVFPAQFPEPLKGLGDSRSLSLSPNLGIVDVPQGRDCGTRRTPPATGSRVPVHCTYFVNKSFCSNPPALLFVYVTDFPALLTGNHHPDVNTDDSRRFKCLLFNSIRAACKAIIADFHAPYK